MATERTLEVPRGTPGASPLTLEMSLVYQAEERLEEVKIVNPATANELAGFFNSAANTVSKYAAWLEYELLKAKSQFDLAKATVILDKLPEEAKKLKDTGLKPNDDWREAQVARDPECAKCRETLEHLEAVKALLGAKQKTFERAYYTCYREKDRKDALPTPNFSTRVGSLTHEPQNLMGAVSVVDDDVVSALK